MDALTKMFSLAGKTAVVTGESRNQASYCRYVAHEQSGGTRGIGAAMALALAEAGADIILVQVSATLWEHSRTQAVREHEID